MPRITLAACWFSHFNAGGLEDGLTRIRDAGYEAIEIWSQDLRRWGVPRWRKALAASGLGCVQLCPMVRCFGALRGGWGRRNSPLPRCRRC